MSIITFTEQYIASRDISKQYANNLRKRAAKLATFVGAVDLGEVFTRDRVNAFLASLTTISPFTLRSYRSDLLSLWNSAADEDLIEYPVMRRIRRPKCPKLRIECYTLDEAKAILAQAKACKPYPMRTGINRRVYWPAIIQVAWDTGLRRGDVWAFRKSWIKPDGSATVIQRKTNQVVAVQLHPSTIEALNAIPFDKACQWPGANANSSRFGKEFKLIARNAGVDRGSFKWLRRASGSYVEMAQPGSGSKHLGHACPQVFNQHYDARLGGHTAPMPPSLDGVERGGI